MRTIRRSTPITSLVIDDQTIPCCPKCDTHKFVASDIDVTKDWRTRSVTCENGHKVSADDLTQRQIQDVVDEEEYAPPEELTQADEEEGIEFAAQFEETTDRDAAILASVWFESILADFIGRFTIDKDGFKPPQTFSARTHFCYFFGLISEKEYNALTVLRGIRNVYAHKRFDKSSFLEDESLADQVRTLGGHFGLKVTPAKEPRAVFNESISIMFSSLLRKLFLVRRCSKMPFDPYGSRQP